MSEKAHTTPGYSFFDFLHDYVYTRWSYLYIGIGTGEHPLAKRLTPFFGRFNELITKKKSTDAAESIERFHRETSIGSDQGWHGE